jgi:hypothetical protein
VVAIATSGSALVAGMNAFWGSVTTGAVAGFAGGVVGTLLNGGSISDALKAGVKGALFGAISAGAAYGVAEMTGSLFGIGSKAAHGLSLFHAGGKVAATLFKAAAHGISRAIMAKAQGGRWSSGFWSGFAGSVLSVGTKGYGGIEGRTMIMAVVGGTVSELTGGKFANSAITGAFVHLFNAEGYTKVGKYFVKNKTEVHSGGKEHVHWGTSSDKRINAVNADGTVRHGVKPPNKVKNFINKVFKNFKIPTVLLLMPEDVIQNIYINQATCGSYDCPKVY